MLSAFDVSDFFLTVQDVDFTGEGITNLKLQKLLYYAQGFHLASYDELLFSETIEAWQHGPVVSEVYEKYKIYGASMIPVPEVLDLTKFLTETKDFLNHIYVTFGKYSAWQLRNATHEEMPWKRGWARVNAFITHEDLKEFFKNFYA